MTAILDFSYEKRKYLANIYFIGFLDRKNIRFAKKNKVLSGLEVEIS